MKCGATMLVSWDVELMAPVLYKERYRVAMSCAWALDKQGVAGSLQRLVGHGYHGRAHAVVVKMSTETKNAANIMKVIQVVY
jgi:hypothetical protein